MGAGNFNASTRDDITTYYTLGPKAALVPLLAGAEDYAAILDKLPGLRDVFPDRERVTPGQRAATVELILEGLHLHKLLNKYDHSGYATYTG